ncbi:MAG TPA: prepilin-type N-terminal cleavage/methylation domain-containing protein [Phycisphaerae bacterium]|nr:prepilin-type N-terminal cleavage/methylation domain-containing protein [Phycisphaerae bacterium]
MRSKAFTLVELLIVVIILGILAAVVIPQFSDASNEARDSSLTTNLATLRGQIELYRLQHNGTYPSATAATFISQMTTKTNPDGTTTGTPTLGPYLQRMPNNPFTNDATFGANATDYGKAWFWDGAGVFHSLDSAANAGL